jgi:heme A synthase
VETEDLVCIANISLRERQKRLVAGIVQCAVALLLLTALITLEIDRWWRLALFLPFFGAASGFLQWREKT